MPGRQAPEALLEECEAHEQNNRADSCLVYDGPDQREQPEPRQEHVQDTVDDTGYVVVTTAAVGVCGDMW